MNTLNVFLGVDCHTFLTTVETMVTPEWLDYDSICANVAGDA